MDNQNDRDTYVIPPNFIDTGTFFGGMFKARNVIEAGILAGGTGVPVFLFLPASLTVRIVALCLTSLPLALVALIGISGESLTSFLVIFLRYIKKRRIIGSMRHEGIAEPEGALKMSGKGRKSHRQAPHNPLGKHSAEYAVADGGELTRKQAEAGGIAQKRESSPIFRAEDRHGAERENKEENCQRSCQKANTKTRRTQKAEQGRKAPQSKNCRLGGISGWKRTGEDDFPAEFDQVKGYEIRQKLCPVQETKKTKAHSRETGGEEPGRRTAADTGNDACCS